MEPAQTGQTDERELVESFVRHRHEAAFRTLYQRHTPRLYLLVRRLLGGKGTEVDDVVQETWVRAAEHLADFQWRSSLSTWLAGIAINCSREALRRRLRRRESSSDELPEPAALAPQTSPGNPFDLERAISQLPDGFREILVLHDVEGFTHAEISRRLGIEVGTSKSQLHRARKKVREILSGTGSRTP